MAELRRSLLWIVVALSIFALGLVIVEADSLGYETDKLYNLPSMAGSKFSSSLPPYTSEVEGRLLHEMRQRFETAFAQSATVFREQHMALKRIQESQSGQSYDPDRHELLPKTGVSNSVFPSYEDSLKRVRVDLAQVNMGLKNVRKHFEDLVPKNGSNREIEGEKFFIKRTMVGDLKVNKAYMGEADTEKGHNENKHMVGKTLREKLKVDDMIRNLVNIKDQRQIMGTKKFTGKVHIDDLRSPLIKDIETSEFITQHSNIELGKVIFVNGVSARNVNLHGSSKVAGMDLSEEVMTLHGRHVLGSCSFERVIAEGGVNASSIQNGQNVKNFADSIIRTDQDLNLPQSVSAEKMKIAGNLDAPLIMGVDFQRFKEDTVKKDVNEFVKDVYFVSPVVVEGSVYVRNGINGDKFPKDFVKLDRDGVGVTNFGSKKFGKVNFGELTVGGHVDSLKTENIVVKNLPQKIYGKKTFASGLIIEQNLDIPSKKLDGVDLESLFIQPDESSNAKISILFEKPVTFSSLNVIGTVNGAELSELSKDLVYKNEENVVINSKKTFLNSLKVGRSVLESSLNEVPYSSFVSTNQSGVISASKTFSNDVVFSNLDVKGLIDSTNLTHLIENSLFLDLPNQTVYGAKIFKNIHAPEMNILNKLNKNKVSSFMSASHDQSFKDVIFKRALFEELKADGVILSEHATVNGIDISEHHKKLTTQTNVEDFLIIEGSLNIKGDLESTQINNQNVDEIFNFLRKDKRNQIFDGNVTFNKLKVHRGISDESKTSGERKFSEIIKNAIPLFDKRLLQKQTLWDHIEVDNIKIGGLINHIDLTGIQNNAVYIDQDPTAYVKGTKIFTNGIYVSEDLSSTVNGIDFRESLFSRTTPQTVKTPITFKDISANDAELVSWNKKPISMIKDMEEKNDTYVHGPIVFGGNVQATSLIVGGLIAGKDIRTVLRDAVRLDKKNAVIGRKIFTKTPVATDLDMKLINGINFDKRLHKFNWADKNFTIDTLISHVGMTSPKVHTKYMNVTKTIDGQSIKKLKNYASLADPEYMRSSISFDSVTILGNLTAKSLNSLNMDEYLTKSTDQNINNAFVSNATMVNLVTKAFNGIELPEKIPPFGNEGTVTLKGPVHLKRPLILNSDVILKGTLGKHRMNIQKDLIPLDKQAVIKGEVKFTSPVITSTFQSSTSMLNGVDLNALQYNLETLESLNLYHYGEDNEKQPTPDDYISMMKKIYLGECQRTTQLESLLTGALATPRSLEYVTEERFHHEFRSKRSDTDFDMTPITIFKAFNSVWMLNALNPESCKAELKVFDKDLEQFVPVRNISGIGYVVQWVVLEETETTASLVSIVPARRNCGRDASALWKMVSADGKLKRVEDLHQADKGMVEPLEGASKRLYLSSVLQTFSYHYSGGSLSRMRPSPGKLELIRMLKLSSGKVVVARLWGGRKLNFEIFEWGKKTIRRWSLPMKTRDIALLRNGDSMYLVISCSSDHLGGERNFLTVLEYENSELPVRDYVELNGPAKLFPFVIDEGRVNSTFIFVLSTGDVPKIFKPRGNPFLQLWSKIPFSLTSSVWLRGFSVTVGPKTEISRTLPVTSKPGIYVVMGDRERMVVTKINWNGRNLETPNYICNLP